MATETSNIDDLLMSGKTSTQPETPEHQQEFIPDDSYDVEYDEPAEIDNAKLLSQEEPEEYQESVPEEATAELDEYGNQKAKPRVYTEDEVNERINKAIRDRLSRMKSQEQPLPSVQQLQQAQEGFNYDPDSSQGWQQQLESFVEQTFNKINQRQFSQAQQQKESHAQHEFEEKFTTGMERFQDFRDVVGAQPISDPMTYALRGMKDPAAFIYAASKRHAPEIQRIAQLADPYAQMVEMGKLEERMRKSAQGTKAPRPIQRSREDSAIPDKKKQEGDSIEDLIARADAKKRAQLTARRGRG